MTKTKRYSVIPRTLCFVYCEEKLLLISYAPSKGEMAGRHNCPGGHIEKGEDILSSANREIYEETGLVVKSRLEGIVHANNFFGKDVMMYVVSAQSSTAEIHDGPEGSGGRHTVSELDQIKVFADVALLAKEIEKKRGVFTAISQFDGQGEMLSFTIHEH